MDTNQNQALEAVRNQALEAVRNIGSNEDFAAIETALVAIDNLQPVLQLNSIYWSPVPGEEIRGIFLGFTEIIVNEEPVTVARIACKSEGQATVYLIGAKMVIGALTPIPVRMPVQIAYTGEVKAKKGKMKEFSISILG